MNKKATIYHTYKSARMCIHAHATLLCRDRDIYKLTTFSLTFIFFFSTFDTSKSTIKPISNYRMYLPDHPSNHLRIGIYMLSIYIML